eukprot:TRINITY_DN5784_c0_g1_i1.p1 TRINITY_DN5784_c0_g1~~TRINITY_DN5784_c0_g1_i1.p1  ORF type:complete len:389 (+),score=63.95 TRINITY_DN5784_c0_g1_i1:75-1169(+)
MGGIQHETNPVSLENNGDGSTQFTTYYSINFKWIVVMWIISCLIGCAITLAFVYDVWSIASPAARASLILSYLPLSCFLVMGGAEPLRLNFFGWMNKIPFLQRRLLLLPIVVTSSYLLATLPQAHFDPLGMVVIFAITFLVPATLRQEDSSSFTWTDAVIWLLIWMPLNLDWGIWLSHPSMDVMWWGLATSLTIILGWGCFRPSIGIGFTWRPRTRDLIVFVIVMVMLALMIVPLSFLTGLVHILPNVSYTPQHLIFVWIQQFVAIAIPEELLFRGIMLQGFRDTTKKDYLSLMLMSIAYALIGWPTHMQSLLNQFYGALFAFVTSMIYGASFLKSQNILAGTVAHSLVNFFLIFFVDLPIDAH